MSDAAKHVLIVEDDDAIREALAEVLEEAGCTVAVAANGSQALTRLRSGGPLPGLILLDLMMPVMDGFEFSEAQSLDPQLRNIPVVVMSAAGHVEANLERTRAASYLRKPMTIEAILEVIVRHLP
jgi:CheY-like chemotaxis protein